MSSELTERQVLDLKVARATQIEVPFDAVKPLVRKAYELSVPVGMGMIHYRPGPLDSMGVDELVRVMNKTGYLSMDYVHGRQVKFTIRKIGDYYFVHRRWPDHTEAQLIELLASVGVEFPTKAI